MQALVLSEVERAGAHGITLERLEWILESYRNIRRLDPPKDPAARCPRYDQSNQPGAQLAAGKPRICDARAGDRRYRIEPTYDPLVDISRSVQVGFEMIRQRVKNGGPGWGESI